jgi:hypothetical protein
MGDKFRELKEDIENIYAKESYFYSTYIFNKLKNPDTLKLINEIVNKSHKTPAEVIIILLAAIKYIQNDIKALLKLEETNSFDSFIIENYKNILNICINRKVQANIPERGLPILEIIGRKLLNQSVCVIELGASCGLIGRCLLNTGNMLENRHLYFHPDQKFPDHQTKINYYLGIDIEPVEKEWLIAGLYNPDDATRLKNYINEIKKDDNFELLQASAIGFSKLHQVQKLVKMKFKIVVLTSFMLYQFEEKQKQLLKNEINEFTRTYDGHWISQEVDLSDKKSSIQYYIEFDGNKIIELEDDMCRNWKWL